MMWEFHTFWEDPDLLSIAYEWYIQSPEFVKSISTFIEDKEEFIKNLNGSINFCGIVDNKIFGIVHGEEKTKEIVEGHLFCRKDTDIDQATSLVIYSKNNALEHYKVVITSVLTSHKFLIEVMNRSGFIDTGMRSIQAVYKNKMIEVAHYTSGEMI